MRESNNDVVLCDTRTVIISLMPHQKRHKTMLHRPRCFRCRSVLLFDTILLIVRLVVCCGPAIPLKMNTFFRGEGGGVPGSSSGVPSAVDVYTARCISKEGGFVLEGGGGGLSKNTA